MATPRGLQPRAGESIVEIAFNFSGAPDIVRQLRALDARASDWSPAWPEVDTVFRMIVRQQFATEGAHGGEPWPQLAPRTQAERRAQGRRAGTFGPAHPILRRSNRLMRSLTEATGDTISVHHPRYYAIGSAVEYYPYHQSRAPRTKIPRRAPVELTAADKNELMRPVRVYLRGGDPARNARQDAALRSTFAQGPF